jgi:hypothetical protein
MQLRVARLCLDCEEVFVGDVCPVCASEHYAFLSTWLPVEERRRWRRPAAAPAGSLANRLAALRQFFRDAFGDGAPVASPGPPRTRRSDHIPPLDFDAPRPPVLNERPSTERQPARGDVR